MKIFYQIGLELGFNLDKVVEAWGIYGDNEDKVINYLTNSSIN